MIRRQIRRANGNYCIVGLVCLLYGGMTYLSVLFVRHMTRLFPPRLRAGNEISEVFSIGTAIVVLIPGAFFLGRALLYLFVPRLHPIMRRLAVFGPGNDLADEIDRELAEPSTEVVGAEGPRAFELSKAMGSTVFITRSWLLQPTQFGMKIVRLQEVLGICRFVFSRRFRRDNDPDLSDLSAPGFSNGIEVMVRAGKDERFVVAAYDLQRLLRILFARVPWAMSGFDTGYERRWKMDRAGLAEGIQAERQQIQGLSPEACQALVDEKVRRAEEQARLLSDKDPRKSS